jgi:hypothetical protein
MGVTDGARFSLEKQPFPGKISANLNVILFNGELPVEKAK